MTPSRAQLAGLVTCGLMTVASRAEATACPGCVTSQEVWWQVTSSSPLLTLGFITFGFACVGSLVLALSLFAPAARWLFAGTLLLGAGLGGFLDGILLHQVLQWHAMLSNVVPVVDLVTSKVNMFWDGLFHLYCWCATLLGIGIIVSHAEQLERRSRTRLSCGGALAGWGLFNVTEGVLNHQLLGLHHVHPGINELAWDGAFLGFGTLLVALGGALSWSTLRRSIEP